MNITIDLKIFALVLKMCKMHMWRRAHLNTTCIHKLARLCKGVLGLWYSVGKIWKTTESCAMW